MQEARTYLGVHIPTQITRVVIGISHQRKMAIVHGISKMEMIPIKDLDISPYPKGKLSEYYLDMRNEQFGKDGWNDAPIERKEDTHAQV